MTDLDRMRDLSKEPLARIEWRDARDLRGNDWNPNAVLDTELRLLEHSIVTIGWIQPILINRTGLIIDGFHRHRLAIDSVQLRKLYGDWVPCAVLDVSDADAMTITVRINRAKGSHGALRMSALVQRLVNDHGYEPSEIAQEIGATNEEVSLLLQESVFKQRNIANYRYSRSWVPTEDGKTRKERVGK